jgi:hypothetical protein
MSSPAQPTPPGIQHNNPPSQKLTPAQAAKLIDKESQSKNSFERLFIVRLLAIGLVIALGLDVVAYYAVYYFTPADHTRP